MKQYKLYVDVVDDGNGKYVIASPQDADKMLRESLHLDKMIEEYIYLIGLATTGEVIGVSEISHGTIASATFEMGGIYRRAILMGCKAIMIAHNHPSGNPAPSIEDLNITKQIKDCGDLLGIQMLDHIIVGHESYYSCTSEEEFERS